MKPRSELQTCRENAKKEDRKKTFSRYKEGDISKIFSIVLTVLKELKEKPEMAGYIDKSINIFEEAIKGVNGGISTLSSLTKEKITADLAALKTEFEKAPITPETVNLWSEVECWLDVYHYIFYIQTKRNKDGRVIEAGPIDIMEDRAFNAKVGLYKYDVALLYKNAAVELEKRIKVFNDEKIKQHPSSQANVIRALNNQVPAVTSSVFIGRHSQPPAGYTSDISVTTEANPGFERVIISACFYSHEELKKLAFIDNATRQPTLTIVDYLAQYKDKDDSVRFNVLVNALGNFNLTENDKAFLNTHKNTIISGLDSYINKGILFSYVNAEAAKECKLDIDRADVDGKKALELLFDFWNKVESKNSTTLAPICKGLLEKAYEYFTPAALVLSDTPNTSFRRGMK